MMMRALHEVFEGNKMVKEVGITNLKKTRKNNTNTRKNR